jgi:hypothetical protein
MFRIGRAFGVDPWAIADANANVAPNPNRIFPGQVLCIPPRGTVSGGGSGGPIVGQPNAPVCTHGNGVWNPFGIPRFWIAAVEGGKTVTILTENFPPGHDFEVRMGNYGTAAVGGTVVTSTNSCNGGAFRMTYTIPDGLKANYMIAIRMDNYTGGYYAYNYFYNTTAVAIP